MTGRPTAMDSTRLVPGRRKARRPKKKKPSDSASIVIWFLCIRGTGKTGGGGPCRRGFATKKIKFKNWCTPFPPRVSSLWLELDRSYLCVFPDFWNEFLPSDSGAVENKSSGSYWGELPKEKPGIT